MQTVDSLDRDLYGKPGGVIRMETHDINHDFEGSEDKGENDGMAHETSSLYETPMSNT